MCIYKWDDNQSKAHAYYLLLQVYILSNSTFDRKANKEKEKEDKNNI